MSDIATKHGDPIKSYFIGIETQRDAIGGWLDSTMFFSNRIYVQRHESFIEHKQTQINISELPPELQMEFEVLLTKIYLSNLHLGKLDADEYIAPDIEPEAPII